LEDNMVNDATGDRFKASVRGEVIGPNHARYDSARKVYNAMIDKRPRLIVRCSDVADVIAAVNFAKQNGLLLAIRGGGHNGAGLGVCDDGLVVDLSLMTGVRVDPVSHLVRVEGGARWGDVDHATHAFGLAVPSGIVSTTGVGGLTLGGGHGYLARKYGLTIDNLVEADVVLADGHLVTANDRENEDLFWAIRGGGGNFGVVTSFLFRAHPVKTVYAGPVLWSADRSAEVMQWYREFFPTVPEDLYGFFAFLNVPQGPPFPEHLHAKTMCGIIWCYTGPLENADQVFRPILHFGPPAFALVGPMPFPALQGLFDDLMPPGLQWYWKGDFVRELSDAAIAEHLKYGLGLPTPLSTMHLYPVDGAVSRVGKSDTAFSHRDAQWSMVICGIDPGPVNNKRITTWAKDYWSAMHPYSAGGAYVNFMMEEGQDRIKATYGDNYERLVAIKRKLDPANVFRVNRNIKPI
jgi:FAD/FMN-containing dehydrogenase